MIIQGKIWGHTTPLFNKNNVELHIACIKKGGYCSKHLHKFKYNRFVVLKGRLKVTIWKNYGTETLEDISILETSQECTVSPGDFHKFEALEETTCLEIYWVDLNENDIVRLDHGGMLNEKTTDLSSDNERAYERIVPSNQQRAYAFEYADGENIHGNKRYGNSTD